MPALAFNHGSGSGSAVTDFLQTYAQLLPQAPTGILVVEAHMKHETSQPVQIVGDSALAARVAGCLHAQEIPSRLSPADSRHPRGAHGIDDATLAFKSVPLVAISVAANGADARQSLSCGQALAPLREQGVLILGSGVPAFHNFDLLRHGPKEVERVTAAFGGWLTDVLAIEDSQARLQALSKWQEAAPSAQQCHPGHDTHFSPTLVVAGACLEPGLPVHASTHRNIIPEAGPEGWPLMRHFEFR